MPDTTTTDTPAETGDVQQPPSTQPEPPKPTETVEFWKQKAREQETRAKSNATAAQRLAELEESQKTDAQKLVERQTQAERERDDARAETMRYKAVAKHQVPEDYWDLLGSGTEEDITGRAERISGLLSARTELDQVKAELATLKAGRPNPSNQPIEQLRPGATPTVITEPSQTDYPEHWLPRRSHT